MRLRHVVYSQDVTHEHLPSVVSRFVEYYAALDSQPPVRLVGLYHSNATLIDPFGEHDGIFALQRYFTHLLANVEHCRL